MGRTLHLNCFLLPVVLLSMALSASAQAGVTHNNWNYALDSTNDGSGGSAYEYLGLAFSQQADKLLFALSTNMPISGNTQGNQNALNQSIAHGDLFINFSGANLTSPDSFYDSNVFAIRFSAANDALNNRPDTPNHTLGLYGYLSTDALATSNRGYATLQKYINAGFGRSVDAMGDLESSTLDVVSYLGNGSMQTVIKFGTRLADASLLSEADLLESGLDFAAFGDAYVGTHVFGFSVDAEALPVGDFLAHVFMECINDGVAISAQTSSVSVPEPASLALLAASGSLMLPKRRKRA